MKYKLTILTISIFLIGCFPKKKYKIDENAVYLTDLNEVGSEYTLRLEDADPKTFQIIETDCNLLFGKDRSHIFVDRTMLENADPNTFRHIGQYYFADKDSVYFFGWYNELNDCEIIGANPKTMKVHELYPWAQDDSHVIYGHTITTTKDLNELKIIDKNWSRTTNTVFYKGKALDSVDISTFEIISEVKARDKKHTYVDGQMHPNEEQ
ncbi:MAG: DKNYY domain-containing protein [Cytophagales bacterium]|nr:DKNYY domain-containing protein [Cytophagales bacterium]